MFLFFFFLMIRRPPRSTLSSSSAASDVYKRQGINAEYGERVTAAWRHLMLQVLLLLVPIQVGRAAVVAAATAATRQLNSIDRHTLPGLLNSNVGSLPPTSKHRTPIARGGSVCRTSSSRPCVGELTLTESCGDGLLDADGVAS
eukprot:TRINITY_DN15925_c0_g1_i3.p1 TRINITY_DN15925_c0_g1~~TRINITY_DN15925_c0_g1_i3.p1  ORF type:complete len:144 (+),score=27.54 TRINITY_DN15925_c0_g1_i3:110-541(+)